MKKKRKKAKPITEGKQRVTKDKGYSVWSGEDQKLHLQEHSSHRAASLLHL